MRRISVGKEIAARDAANERREGKPSDGCRERAKQAANHAAAVSRGVAARSTRSCRRRPASDKHDMDPSIYRLRQRDILSFCVCALLCLGMVMVQSAAMNVTGKTTWQW